MAVTLNPMAIINVIEDKFNAIWLAACAFLPNAPLNQIAAVKIATSNNICRALGKPRLMIFFEHYNYPKYNRVLYLGHKCLVLLVLFLSKSQMITIMATREIKVPIPAPTIPSFGKPNFPKINSIIKPYI